MTSPEVLLMWSRKAAAALSCALSALGAGTAVHAADDRPVGHWWGGIDGGYAAVRESFVNGDASTNRFAMNFRGGLIAAPRLLVGIELGGFLIESGNTEDPSRGRGISQVFGVAQWYFGPSREGLYARAGGGYASFWGNHAGDTKKSGWGTTLALGWDVRTRESGAIGPVLSWTRGSMGNADYNAVMLGVSWAYQ